MSVIKKTFSRREALGLLGVASAALSAGCDDTTPASVGTSPSPTPTTTTVPTTTTTPNPTPPSSPTCVDTPNETVGPFPSLDDFARVDIREGKPGLPLTLVITVVNVNNLCQPIVNATVDVWQCDAEGNYSQYGSQRNLTYLRGVQQTDAAGQVTFTTIYPGWYQGRATHIHVEVSLNGRPLKTTQIAFPEDITAAVYRTGVYASGGQNPTTNARDMVFSDGFANELVTLVGDPTNGFTGRFQVGIPLV